MTRMTRMINNTFHTIVFHTPSVLFSCLIVASFGVKCNICNSGTVLKGKFHYILSGDLNFLNFEFSIKIGELSTSIGSISTIAHFFVDKFFIPPLAGITSFAILISVDWCAVRIIPNYIFPFC